MTLADMETDPRVISLVTAAGRAKTERQFSALIFKARKLFSGPNLVALAEAMRFAFETTPKENPMARKATKKKAAKRRKSGSRSVAPKSKHYTITKYNEDGGFLGHVAGKGTRAAAENKAHKLCKGKVCKVVLDY